MGRRQGRQIVPVTQLTYWLKKTGKGRGLNLEGPQTRRIFLLLHVFCTNTMTYSITHERPDETITRSKLRLETIFFTTKHGSNMEQQQRLTLETKRSVPQQLKFVFAQDIKRKNCLSFSLKQVFLYRPQVLKLRYESI